jgi:hypothetical protein
MMSREIKESSAHSCWSAEERYGQHPFAEWIHLRTVHSKKTDVAQYATVPMTFGLFTNLASIRAKATRTLLGFGYEQSAMDAVARYRRDVLEFIIGPPVAITEGDVRDELSPLDLQWPCGCRASGRNVFQVFPCAEHVSEFEGTHDGSSMDGHSMDGHSMNGHYDGVSGDREGIDGSASGLG